MAKYTQIRYVCYDHILLLLYGLVKFQKPPVEIRFSLFVDEYGMWGRIIELQNAQAGRLLETSSAILYFTESKASLPVGHYLVTSGTLWSYIPWVQSKPGSEIYGAPREVHSTWIKQNKSRPHVLLADTSINM